jgi:V8-like Glu-specific endopeptidase
MVKRHPGLASGPAGILVGVMICGSAVPADGVVSIKAPAAAADATAQYWTPMRLAAARARALPIAMRGGPAASVEPAGSRSMSSPSMPPEFNGEQPVQLYDPVELTGGITIASGSAQVGTDAVGQEDVEPEAEGTLPAPYTSNRLLTSTTHKRYPYKAVGKLFFTGSDGWDYVCSAAVISYRLIATAGHCVHDGNGLASGWSSNIVFVPAYRNGSAPYQSWTWAEAATTGEWFAGSGAVPNAADYAIIRVNDAQFGSRLKKLGVVTGILGWRTLALARNHVHMLGYPCNLDDCEQMHEVTSGSFRGVAPNSVEFGSDMRGGSSGGPWIQNFGAASDGQTGGFNTVRNELVGITSYGFISTDPKVQGSSILDNRWVALWNLMCSSPGACTKTP